MKPTATTFHTYPLLTGFHEAAASRPARCDWETTDPQQAINATINMDGEAIVLAVRHQDGLSPLIVGLKPGGLGPRN